MKEKFIPGQVRHHQILWHWMHLQLLQLCKHSVQTASSTSEVRSTVVGPKLQPDTSGGTVVSGVQAFDGAAADSQAGDGVPVAAKDLQPAENRDVQLRQPAVPHVQLDDVAQLLWLPHRHLFQAVQPETHRTHPQSFTR